MGHIAKLRSETHDKSYTNYLNNVVEYILFFKKNFPDITRYASAKMAFLHPSSLHILKMQNIEPILCQDDFIDISQI